MNTEHRGRTPEGSRARPRDGAADRAFLVGIARAFGGAIFFSLPLLMTMEMWWLGIYMQRLRLALFVVLFLPLLVGLSRFAGFEPTADWRQDARDAFVALFVGFVTAAAVLTLAGVLGPGMPLDEIVGKVTLEAMPASVGAALAASLLRGRAEGEERKKREAGYAGEMLLMTAGAIFFAFNVAPTEEIVLIAFKMSYWHVVATGLTSLLLMHAFVYGVDFHGQETPPPGVSWWSVFARFSVVGYAIALVISAYVLWTFGRYDDLAPSFWASGAVVLALPASLGAAAARLIL